MTESVDLPRPLGWKATDREASRRKAEEWTKRQAARFGTNSETILAAIKGPPSWLPEQIEQVQSVQELEGKPPVLNGVEPWVDVRLNERAKREAQEAAAEAGNQNSVMADAMKRARAA